ncbi:hypothetical protein B0H11DRAFT_2363802 [Mycena galericulata]|nr:hypothetical protein B0H11DRAFT_2363802 [Mycena galericulata]
MEQCVRLSIDIHGGPNIFQLNIAASIHVFMQVHCHLVSVVRLSTQLAITYGWRVLVGSFIHPTDSHPSTQIAPKPTDPVARAASTDLVYPPHAVFAHNSALTKWVPTCFAPCPLPPRHRTSFSLSIAYQRFAAIGHRDEHEHEDTRRPPCILSRRLSARVRVHRGAADSRSSSRRSSSGATPPHTATISPTLTLMLTFLRLSTPAYPCALVRAGQAGWHKRAHPGPVHLPRAQERRHTDTGDLIALLGIQTRISTDFDTIPGVVLLGTEYRSKAHQCAVDHLLN